MLPQAFWRRPTFWATILLFGLTVLFLAAGTWQMFRARYKDELQAKIMQTAAASPLEVGARLLNADTANLHRTQAHGTWLAEHAILLDNKVQDGIVGYEVLTPLRLAGGQMHVLVNRGWVKAPQLRSDLPSIQTPAGPVDVSGIARVPTGRFIELGAQHITGQVWQNLTMERYAAWSGLVLQPFVIYQSDANTDGLVRVLPAPEAAGMNADRHRGYAVTWYGLAAVTIVLGLFAWRQNRKQG